MHGFIDPPPPPKPDPHHQSRNPGTAKPHSPQPTKAADWNLHLEAAGTNLPARYLRDNPSATVLAVEDLCWEAAVEDWKQRRPPRWRARARSAWRAEGIWLAAKASHLRGLADEVIKEL